MTDLVNNSGDTTWVLVSAALVLFMVPGLALFYAGLVRRGNALVMMQQNLIPIAVISLTWVLIGYSIAFSDDFGSGFMGDLKLFGLTGIGDAPAPALHAVDGSVAIPTLSFVAFQMMFAIITPALLTGATAGRLKTTGWVFVLIFWSVLVYPFVAHWLFNPDGWLATLGAQDWAGGIVVHAAAGASGLAILLVVGRRAGWPETKSIPHSIPLAVVGAGILWFGWFGFNGGGSLQGNGVAAQAVLNTHVAGAAGMAAWLVMERLRTGRMTVIGAVTGGVAGLATITPCAGYVSTLPAVVIGLVAGVVCTLALALKDIFKFDDALDVIAVHFVGGIIGSLMLGLFGSATINSAGKDGLFYGGGLKLLGAQALALVVVIAFSFVVTLLIAVVAEKTVGLKLPVSAQLSMDEAEEGADAYTLGPVLSRTQQNDAKASTTSALAAGLDGAEEVLVSATFAGADLDELAAALTTAGARAIQVSEVNEVVSAPTPVTVRGVNQGTRFATRVHVEMRAGTASVDAVLAVLGAQTADLSAPTVYTLTQPRS